MKLFATRVWGMGFERIPIATFGMKGHVDRLLRKRDFRCALTASAPLKRHRTGFDIRLYQVTVV
ncbi:hypothetical protein FHS26_006876, partial [Rhizobium pisi]